MISKIFRRKDGSYTMKEFEDSTQNVSVIPPKYKEDDKYQKYRLAEK